MYLCNKPKYLPGSFGGTPKENLYFRIIMVYNRLGPDVPTS